LRRNEWRKTRKSQESNTSQKKFHFARKLLKKPH
jgi:hypothetical protein